MNIPLTPPCRNRTAKQILAEIRKESKAHHGAPVRMDVHQSEAAAITAASAALTAQGWGRVYHLHLDEQRDAEGWGRFVFLPPGMRPPPSNSPEIKSLCFSQDEIIRALSNSFMDHRVMVPDYERGKKQVSTLRAIAPKGGKASPAKYKDGDIEKALIRYKGDNPNRTLWEACSALIRPGCNLSKYKHVNGLWQRVQRMAQSQLGIDGEAFFDSL
jgi:hypothetical protein